MFTRGTTDPVAADSIVIVEGEFKFHYDEKMVARGLFVKLLMAYMSKENGTTFGTCPVEAHLLSDKTRELFDEFCKSAEEDYGKIFFGKGVVKSPMQQSLGSAESDQSPTFKGLGET